MYVLWLSRITTTRGTAGRRFASSPFFFHVASSMPRFLARACSESRTKSPLGERRRIQLFCLPHSNQEPPKYVSIGTQPIKDDLYWVTHPGYGGRFWSRWSTIPRHVPAGGS